jgi:hypothetical protein
MLEFSMTAVPLLFVIISLGYMALGMWQYHTLAEAVNMTARVAAVHGAGCAGQSCATTVANMEALLAAKAIGIPASSMNVTFTSSASTVTCNPLSSCSSNSAAWPSLSGNVAGTTDISIKATYQFSSAIGMWSTDHGGVTFNPVTLAANATQAVAN